MSLYEARLKEPRRALQKAMARRAKTSHLGAFHILPEHVLLSCCAILPREDHDAVADCSTGFRAVMRSERFLKARRAEDINEEALVVISGAEDFGFLALVSGRVWRRLPPMPAEMRPASFYRPMFRGGTAVIGSEVFLVSGGMTRDGREAGVAVYDAVDDEWFTMPLPPSHPRDLFAVACAGELFIGGVWAGGPSVGQVPLWRWDAEAQEWMELPPMPRTQHQNSHYPLIALGVGLEIFVLDRCDPVRFRVFDTETETWSSVDIPDGAGLPVASNSGWGSEPWPILIVDQTLIRIINKTDNRQCIYDAALRDWMFDTARSMERHMACSDSDRVLSVSIMADTQGSMPFAPGWLNVYQRDENSILQRLNLTKFSELPLKYYAVQRVCYVDMP